MWLTRGRVVLGGRRHQMVLDDSVGASEPERGELREDLPLVRDHRPQHEIVGGDAIGRHHQEMAVNDIHVPDLAASLGGETVERSFEQGMCERHGGPHQVR